MEPRVVTPISPAALRNFAFEAKLLTLAPGRTYNLGIPGETTFDFPCSLHWDIDQKRTVPCWECDSCPYCLSPVRLAVYVPAWIFWHDCTAWIRRVVCFSEDAYESILPYRKEMNVWAVTTGKDRRDQWTFKGMAVPDAPHNFSPYAIVPLLRRLWGRLTPPSLLG